MDAYTSIWHGHATEEPAEFAVYVRHLPSDGASALAAL